MSLKLKCYQKLNARKTQMMQETNFIEEEKTLKNRRSALIALALFILLTTIKPL